jgi:protein gp37
MSRIEWTEATWNPVTGCTKVSEGCRHCYAEAVARRFWPTQYPPTERTIALTKEGPVFGPGPRRFTDVLCHTDRLAQPLKWRKPRRVFVNSMSDLFHPDVPDDFILNVFTVMAVASQHTFQVLTKRPARMAALLASWRADDMYTYWHGYSGQPAEVYSYPLLNVWAGVSVEDQPTADARIPLLLQTPAVVRFVSYEPALGPVAVESWLTCPACGRNGTDEGRHRNTCAGRGSLDWIIVGGESGPQARPCDVEWIRSVVEQCKAATAPVFVKQLGAYPRVEPARLRRWEWRGINRPEDKRFTQDGDCWRVHLASEKGGDPSEWPETLRVREMPA